MSDNVSDAGSICPRAGATATELLRRRNTADGRHVNSPETTSLVATASRHVHLLRDCRTRKFWR